MRIHWTVATSIALATAVAARAEDPITPVQPATAAEATTASTPVDAPRLAIANHIALQMLPRGAYREIMDSTMRSMADNIVPMLTSMRAATPHADTKADRQAAHPNVTSTNRLDPAVMTRLFAIIADEIGPIITEMEPHIRDGVGQSLARRFTIDQLNDLERFFATPSGATYARQSMALLTDPEVVHATVEIMPQLIRRMPAIAQRMEREFPGSGQSGATDTTSMAADKTE